MHLQFNMKLFVLAAFLALGASKHLARQNEKISQIITDYGYSVESYTVTTQDGYILQLYRIPQGNQQDSQQSSEQQRPAVLLMHGLMSSAEDFVYGGPTQGLAFSLADEGYDVYLGSARGSIYGQQHTVLDPAKDSAFWQYSFHQIGTQDLPAMVDKVIAVSQQNQIYFVGHMEGATAFYVLGSQRPEYNQKIAKAVCLGPVAFVKKSTNPLLEIIAENQDSKSWIMKNLGISTFRPSPELLNNIQQNGARLEHQRQLQQQIVQNIYFLYKGQNFNSYNQTTIQQAILRVPSGGTVRQVLHWAQLKQSGEFQTYQQDADQEPEDYQLSKVSVPVAIFYTSKDSISQVDDIQTLLNQLPNVYKTQVQHECDNNLAFIYGKKLEKINRDVAEALAVNVQQEKQQRWLEVAPLKKLQRFLSTEERNSQEQQQNFPTMSVRRHENSRHRMFQESEQARNW